MENNQKQIDWLKVIMAIIIIVETIMLVFAHHVIQQNFYIDWAW